jgi:K+/H+ antiporter YhaU regulatory subunit KhtT
MDVLPGRVDWPIAFREVRIQSGSAFSGKMLREIPLRSVTGASILAVSRAGRVNFDPGPDYQIYPGDRLVIVGPLEDLRKAEDLLQELQDADDQGSLDRFEIEEIRIEIATGAPTPTLSDLQFRQRYGVTVVGIRRGEERITTPGPDQKLEDGDRLIVIGTSNAVETLKGLEPLRTS